MSLYEGAVKKPIMTSLCFLAVAIFGLFSLSKLPVDLYPDIETNTIMVMTTYQGASASDIENNVTRPLENVLNSVSNLKRTLTYLTKYTYIHCYLDNDLAGQKTVETIAGMYGRCVYNESNCYAGYKDLNDYLRGEETMKKPLPKLLHHGGLFFYIPTFSCFLI